MACEFANSNGIQIRFFGRVPWVNVIRIYHKGDCSFDLSVKDIYKKETQADFMMHETIGKDGMKISVYCCNDMRISAIVLTRDNSNANSKGDGTLEIFEVEAFFESADSDDGDEEVGVEYVQYYKHKPCGGSNIKGTKSDALDFRDKLYNKLGWTRKFTWSNYWAFEMDFNIHDDTRADDVDFAYFCGHGNNGKFIFSHMNMDCSMYYTECLNRWGDNDMEWIAVASCRTLRQTNSNQYWSGWYRCFAGLHVMLGWHTNMLDVNIGTRFGNQLAKKHRTIWTSWKNAARKSHYVNLWTHTRKIVAIAEEEVHMSDHIWGAGSVAADYPNNGNYHYRWHKFRGYKEMEPSLSVDPLLLSPVQASAEPEQIILVSDELLNFAKRSPMPHLLVNPTVVDPAYIENLAGLFCSNYNIFCDYDLTYDQDEAEYELFDGPHELEILEESGGWEYNQTAVYGMPVAAPPTLPNDSDAQDSAQAFWMSFGLLTPTAVLMDPECLETGVIESQTGNEFEDSTYYLNVNVQHIRTDYGYNILGPGANLEVVFGNNCELQSAYYGGWRDIYESGTFEPITLADALGYVAASGPEVTLTGMPMCDEFIVDNAELGYYEAPMDTFILELQPVWQVNGFCVYDEDTTAYQVLIPADYPIPHGIIQEPAQDTSIDCGEGLNVYGAATGGTPPYQYDWYSDMDGHLGSGQSYQVANLSCTGKEGASAMHTIILEVTDENSKNDWTTVNVRVIAPHICGDSNSDQNINVSDAVWIINYVFIGGDPPDPLESGDTNCDGSVNVSDAVWVINYVFIGGNAPCDTNGDEIPDC